MPRSGHVRNLGFLRSELATDDFVIVGIVLAIIGVVIKLLG